MNNLEMINYIQGLIFAILNSANKKDSFMNPTEVVEFQLLMKISGDLQNGND